MARFSLASDGRRLFWMGSLLLLSVVFSLGFSCAVPLAAIATIGALTQGRHAAFVLIGAVWLANQIIGFAYLHYPLEQTAFAWGGALGAVALLATLTAQWVGGRLKRGNFVLGSTAAFFAAFAAYEGALFAISTVSANGVANFAPAIVLRILSINAVAFAVLLLVHRLIANRILEDKEEAVLSAGEQRSLIRSSIENEHFRMSCPQASPLDWVCRAPASRRVCLEDSETQARGV